ncbi:MAG: hypothetical protein QOE09_3449 [Ilumatobacteraceae bacterium]
MFAVHGPSELAPLHRQRRTGLLIETSAQIWRAWEGPARGRPISALTACDPYHIPSWTPAVLLAAT